jgi:peptidyl-prolyl cis-trans isomerase A (cyclophilin A)
MKNLLLFSLLIILLISCEDTKKKKTNTLVNRIEKKTDTIESPKIIASESTEPKIKLTEENVVSFLKAYGKKNPENKVRITTPYGTIDIELFNETPIHRANFIYLVKQKYFNNTFLHRVVPNFIIQAGSSDLKSTFKKRAAIGSDYRLPYEKGNGRIHSYGTISGAKEYRKNPDKKTSPFEFFIYLGPNTSNKHLNGNYTIYGKVIKGMEVVEVLSELPADDEDWPLNNIYIKAEIIKN